MLLQFTEEVLQWPIGIEIDTDAAVTPSVRATITADVLAAVKRLLPPSEGAAGTRGRKGEASTSALSPSILTVLGDRAAQRNNQVP